ncbi:hypothetical protein IKE19_02900 [Candidatus Saccharibacteria bacterium]|nr:hypothetical protein [Candidatus Saccharibacteria bacterium]
MFLILAIAFVWIGGISYATFLVTDKRNSSSYNLIKTLKDPEVTYSMEEVLDWVKHEDISVDYKGMLE